MRVLNRVHDTAFGVGLFCSDGSQINIAANGNISCDGFSDIEILQSIDPHPITSIIYLRQETVWLSLSHPAPEGVGAYRLMEICEKDQPRVVEIITRLRNRQLHR